VNRGRTKWALICCHSWLRAFCVDFIIFYLIFCSVNIHVSHLFFNIYILFIYVQEQAGPHARPVRTSSWCVTCLPVVALSPLNGSPCHHSPNARLRWVLQRRGDARRNPWSLRRGTLPTWPSFFSFLFVLLFTLACACRACVGCSSQSPKRALELCAQKTSTDWTNYKIDVVFHVPRLGARPVQQLRVDITPSASAMVLRGSSYVPPDVADRGLILATLVKGICVTPPSEVVCGPFTVFSPLTRRLRVQDPITGREETQMYD